MSPVIVIGGGFAGLSAAVALADAGIPVTLLESRNSLGGRARSFVDPASQEVVDNGQHLFLAGYRATREFLKGLGTDDLLLFQKNLQVTFVEVRGARRKLSCPALPSPWHLVAGLVRFPGFSFRDKLALFRLKNNIRSAPRTETLDSITAREWLARLGFSERGRRNFWDPLTVAALNEESGKASALGLARVLQTLFLSPWQDARLGISSVGLSALYAEAAGKRIERNGGRVLLNTSVAGLEFEGGLLQNVRLADGSALAARAAVSAVPPSVLSRLLPERVKQEKAFSTLSRFSTSPIVSVNLWLDRPVTDSIFVGMIGTHFQWLFNKESYIALILSAAIKEIDESNEWLTRMALEDLESCFPEAKPLRIVRSQVVREREATVSLGCGMEQFRPPPATPYRNFFLAGDWTATGLPATIESAVQSGNRAASALRPLFTISP